MYDRFLCNSQRTLHQVVVTMDTRMPFASASAQHQEHREQLAGTSTSTLPDFASSDRPSSPMSISSTASPSTPLQSARKGTHFQQGHVIQNSSFSPSPFSIYNSPSAQAPSFNNFGSPVVANSTSSSTTAAGIKAHRRVSLSLNLTKPLRCTSLHQSMVPPSPESAVVANSPRSRRNSVASARSGSGSGSDNSGVSSVSTGQMGYNNHAFHGIGRNSSPATLQQREGSSSLSALGMVSSAASTPNASNGMGSSSSSDEEADEDLEDIAADAEFSRNFDTGDKTGPSFAIDRTLLRKHSVSSRNGSSDSSSISSPNTPNMFPPTASSSQFNTIITPTGAPGTATSSYFPRFPSTDDDMPLADQATESRRNSATSRLREHMNFKDASPSTPPAQPAPIPNSPIEEMPRRAVVFSRLGGGSLKPQTRSFMRVTRELADEFAPADAEIKHEAEITMAFRDESGGGEEDDYEDDEDDDDMDVASSRRRADRRKQKFNNKYKDCYPAVPTQDTIFPTDTAASPSASGKLLESPPFQRRKRAASGASVGYWSDQRGDDDDDMLNDTDDGPRDDTGVGIPSASASPVTGAMFIQAMKRPSEGWESPLSTSPVGSTALDRKLKRRGTVDERFEPYSIKRRAVSPGMVTAASPTVGSSGTFAAGKRSMKQMQDTYDRIQKMSLN
ncbi:hypothetical protein V1519DRAFT_284385 [Lipomyces tetrasporus]